MIHSVMPIITKCKLVSHEVEDVDDKVDIEMVQGQLTDCFAEELKRQFRDLYNEFPEDVNIDQLVSENGEVDKRVRDDDQKEQILRLKAVK